MCLFYCSEYPIDSHPLSSTASDTIPDSTRSKPRHRKSYTDDHKMYSCQIEHKQHSNKEENRRRSRSASGLLVSYDNGVHRNVNISEDREGRHTTRHSDVRHRRYAMSSDGQNRSDRSQLTKRSKSPHAGTFQNLLPEKTITYLQQHKLNKERQDNRDRTQHRRRHDSSLKVRLNERKLRQNNQHYNRTSNDHYNEHDTSASDSDEHFSWPDIPDGVAEDHGHGNNHAFDHTS